MTKIYSNKVANLTLVDLPGITKVPVGDQPQDIEKRVHDMIHEFIKNPNCLILAVTPANSDLANSDALKLAAEVDPERKRTIAVITKLDIMDAGTDASKVLRNEVIPFQLGIIGVVNRSQKDIMDNKSIVQTLEDEKRFLKERYPSMAEKNGTGYLCQTLSKLLIAHIRKCLPELKIKVKEKEAEFSELHKSCGKPVENKSFEMAKIIDEVTNFYRKSMEGLAFNTESEKLSGGGSLSSIFHEEFAQDLLSIDPLQSLSDEKIKHAIRSGTSPSPTLFVSDVAFRKLVKEQVCLLKDPCLHCVELVYEEMMDVFEDCATREMHKLQRFPKIRQEIFNVVAPLLHHHMKKAAEKVDYQVAIHTTHINTKHPDFKGELFVVETLAKKALLAKECLEIEPDNSFVPSISLTNGPQSPQYYKLTSEEKQAQRALEEKRQAELEFAKKPEIEIHCDNIKKLVTAYFDVVRNSLQDSVPKAVMHSLVRNVKKDLGPKLNEHFSEFREKMEDLFSESSEIEERRKRSEEMLKVLRQASRIISEIGATN